MNGWIQSLAAYLLICSLAMQLLPGSKYEGYVKLFAGFLLMLLIIQPILKIGAADRYLEEKVKFFLQEQELLEKEFVRESEAFFQKNKVPESVEVEGVCVEEIEKVEVKVKLND